MDKNRFNISSIETFFNELLTEMVSVNMFFTAPPNNIDTTWTHFIVVDCATSIRDLNAFGRGTVLVWLYARPLSSGKKNVAVMSKMEKLLNEAIDSNPNPNYAISRLGEYADYNTDVGMHCNIVQIQLLIV